ncbi:MAG TPA: class I SAM-dependent methyltransferase [Chthoniobacterales bacterium]|nr:class I SAM-dependent methyltransferase [Chthoniobacterales bacterium]
MKYDERIASDYARLRNLHRPLLAALISGSGVHARSNVLELGCGTGNYINTIQSQIGCSAWGIDPSSEMLNKARSQEPVVTWICATAEDTGLTNVQFDFVFNVDAIHHFQDRARVFSGINRLLLETGTLCIATDSEEIIRKRTPLSIYWPETIELEFARYPRIDRLETELRNAGFVNLRREEVGATDWLSDLSPYRAKAFSALRLLSEPTFERGLRCLEADLAKGPIRSLSCYLLLWAKR